MTINPSLPCDGCGQLASPDHLAQRLQRLEWSTRYRPVHIQTLLLSAFPPAQTSAFLYSEALPVEGEAALLLGALEIHWEGESPENYLGEFQKRGLFLMHVLECPLEASSRSAASAKTFLERHLPLALARVRRSLKPRRVVILAPELLPLAELLTESSIGCPILLNLDKPFEIMKKEASAELAAFRLALEGAQREARCDRRH